MEKILNYINGELVEPAGKQYFENYEPATGKPYSYVPDSDERDVEKAYQAAKAAFPEWSKMNKEKRFAILMRVSELIEERLEFWHKPNHEIMENP